MKSLENLSDVITPEEVGGVLKLSTEEVIGLLENGDIQGVKVGQIWRVLKSSLVELLQPGTMVPIATVSATMPACEVKVGELVRQTMTELLEEGRIPADELERLKDHDYSNRVFGLNFALLKDYDPNKDLKEQRYVPASNGTKYPRYWKKVFADQYLVTSEWNLKHRDPFVQWAKQF